MPHEMLPTLDYAGRPPNLARPIEHPGMHLAPQGPSMRPLATHALGGFLLAAGVVLMLGWIAALLFPDTSEGILSQPIIPLIGAAVLGRCAWKLNGSRTRRGWAVGLWIGAGLGLTGYSFVTFGLGYFDWFVVP